MQPDTTQTRILHTFTALHQLRPNWHGALILNTSLQPHGTALSFAANIAGAVCLSLESDAALLRNAQRGGSCDFIVNTLDEAIRAMKNELRKRRPLSIGLAGDPDLLLAEITGRGLAPQLFTTTPALAVAARHFASLGALLIDLEALPEARTTPFWQLHTFTFASAAELRDFDNRALAQIPTEPVEDLRRQWLLSASRLLPRERYRTLWLTAEEAQTLSSHLS